MQQRDLLIDIKKQGISIDSKKYRMIICVIGLICLLISVGFYYGIENHVALMIISMPMEWLGHLLRWLSLNSKTGDILAWILYIGISIMPILCLWWKFKRTKQDIADTSSNITSADWILLPLLSMYTFYMIYCFINPSLMNTIANPEIGIEDESIPVLQSMISGVFYAILIGYLILSLVLNFRRKDLWKQMEQILMTCGILYVGFICYFVPFTLYTQLDQVTGSAEQVVCFIDFILNILPMIWFVGVVETGIGLVQILRENKFEENSAETANRLAERSRQTVIVSVTCNIIGNLFHLAVSSQTTHANYLLSIPFVPLIIAYAGLLLASHLKESALLYDDNQKII